MKLDVGCGQSGTGDVNCDLYIVDYLNHRHNETVTRIETLRIPNFLVCHAQFLPFKDKSFEEVFSSQLIEHTENPYAVVKEFMRVSSSKINIETVHWLGEQTFRNRLDLKWFKEHHVSKFNCKWFYRAAKVSGCWTCNVFVLQWRHIPHNYFSMFRVPYSIRAEFKRNQI
jgi:ubiquinone/menaquinone biosynthesis C-methylase UbiE